MLAVVVLRGFSAMKMRKTPPLLGGWARGHEAAYGCLAAAAPTKIRPKPTTIRREYTI